MTDPADSDPMAGTTGLVTGATSGIGLVTARELARRGATVILVGRDPEKGASTVEAIRRATGNPEVTFLRADLSSQAEIRRLAGEVRGRFPTLKVLVNNAGGMFARRRESVDGIEMNLALNHLAYFLLTDLLIETLIRNAPARVISVSSDAHQWVDGFDFDDPQSRGRYRVFRAYGQSKLANLLFSAELARRLEGTGVTSNALHPGFVATNIFAGNGPIGWWLRLMAKAVATSPERGARTSIYLATAPEVERTSGRYFIDAKEAEPAPAARDPEAARRLWDLSAEWTRGVTGS